MRKLKDLLNQSPLADYYIFHVNNEKEIEAKDKKTNQIQLKITEKREKNK